MGILSYARRQADLQRLSRGASTDAKTPLAQARAHAAAIRKSAKDALDDELYSDGNSVRRRLRAILADSDRLDDAHEKIGAAGTSSGNGESLTGVDAVANPSGAQGAATSSGQQPRDFSPEAVRQRDQQRGIEHCYDARMRQLGFRR